MKRATLEDFWGNAREKRPREEGLLLMLIIVLTFIHFKTKLL